MLGATMKEIRRREGANRAELAAETELSPQAIIREEDSQQISIETENEFLSWLNKRAKNKKRGYI